MSDLACGTDQVNDRGATPDGPGKYTVIGNRAGNIPRYGVGKRHAVRTGEEVAVCGHRPAFLWPDRRWNGNVGRTSIPCADCLAVLEAV